MANVLKVDLHPASLAWGYASLPEWRREVKLFKCFFAVPVVGVRKPSWLDGRREQVNGDDVGFRKAAVPNSLLATKPITTHLRNLTAPRSESGLLATRDLMLMCLEAGVKKANGTTDVDVLRHHLEVLMLRKQFNTVSERRALMLFKLAFLRIHTQRSHRGLLPTLAHNSSHLGVLLLHLEHVAAFGKDDRHVRPMAGVWSRFNA